MDSPESLLSLGFLWDGVLHLVCSTAHWAFLSPLSSSAPTSTSPLVTEKVHTKPSHCSESSLPPFWITQLMYVFGLPGPHPPPPPRPPSSCCSLILLQILLQAGSSFVNGNQIMSFPCLKPWNQNEIPTADLCHHLLPPLCPPSLILFPKHITLGPALGIQPQEFLSHNPILLLSLILCAHGSISAS